MDMENIPPLRAVEQKFETLPAVEDQAGCLRDRLSESGLFGKIEPGQRVCLAVGSRGVTALPGMVRALASAVREHGGEPFIIPAMGSHGGATARGQREVLESLGVDEHSCGAPVVSSMETVDLGRGTADGARLVAPRDALEADWVVVLNRIKEHTAFAGHVESGLVKMLVVGVGKEEGARAYHQYSLRSKFPDYMLELAVGLMKHLRVLAGVGILEDAVSRTVRIEVAPPERFESLDSELLARYREIAPRLPFERAHVLVVEWMGKEISGAGLDTNVIGRSRHPVRPEPDSPRIKRIWVRGLTAGSKGNAKGVGLADFVSRSLLQRLDMDATVKNSLAALVPEHAFIPPALESEIRTLEECFRSSGVIEPAEARVAWIHDTSHLERVLVTPALDGELAGRAALDRRGTTPWLFDERGDLGTFDSHWRAACR